MRIMSFKYHYRALAHDGQFGHSRPLRSVGAVGISRRQRLRVFKPNGGIMRGYVVEPCSPKRRFTRYITDDNALIIERYMTKLCQCRPFEGKLLRLKYVDRMGDNTIAREYLTPLKYGEGSTKQVSSNQATNLIAFAEGFIIAAMINDGYQ